MLVHLMLFHKSFKLYLLISHPHPYFYGMNSAALSWVHWTFLLLHLVYCWMPVLEFLFRYLSLWFLLGTFLYFLLKFSLCSCIVLLSLVSRFMTIILNLLSGKSSTFILFWGFILFLHLEHITLFLQLLICVIVYPLDKTTLPILNE